MTREEAITRIKDHIEVHKYNEQNAVKIFEALNMAIKSLEQPERKKGCWIGGDGSYICSECNSSPIDFIDTMSVSFDAYVETPMNYCPHCGADMRGDRNDKQ